MPCGGIYPYGPLNQVGPGNINEACTPPEGGCWVCGKGGCHHFCDEWDTYIHARCALVFLSTEEGEIVISHGHEVVLNFSLEAQDA